MSGPAAWRDNPPMTSTALDTFIAQASARSGRQPDPADCVLALAPLMLELIDHAGSFLEPQHYRSNASGYTRNLIWASLDAAWHEQVEGEAYAQGNAGRTEDAREGIMAFVQKRPAAFKGR